MTDQPEGPIQALDTGIEILEKLGNLNGAGVSTLAAEIDRPKSTVHRHLKTLENRGYVQNDGTEYFVGLKSLRLGASALNRHPVYSVTKSVVNNLVEETGESAAIAVEEAGQAVYLYYNRTDQAVKTDARLGIRLYLHCTGTGKAILAHLPEERIDQIIDQHGLPKRTPQTITDRDELDAELKRIRQRGIAFDDEERLEGMRGVATPIVNQETGALLGALTVAGPTHRVHGDWFREDIPELLQRATKMIEVNLTYQ
ncbi:IclR family transcriptional regulator [Haladaptatus sp. CMAA 1911]|uniref:IclR family transcriptional regulator n=1 Tax=unclassified Haladaptatus TaxID=2622732 RepID=UPI0037553FFE